MKKPFLMLLLVVFMGGAMLLAFGCDAPGEVANTEQEEEEPDEEVTPAPAPVNGDAHNPWDRRDPVGGAVSYEDGTYRGVFADRDAVQVNIQFTLEDNIITSIGYRLLSHRGIDYLEPDTEATEALKGQHEQILEYLEGKDIRVYLVDLYEPGDFVDDVDGFAGATIRANKVISAIRDALNRGVYVY